MYKSLHQYTYDNLTGYKKQNVLLNIRDETYHTLRITNETEKIYDFKFWMAPGTKSINIMQYCGTGTSSDPLFSFVISKEKEPTSEPKSSISEVKSLPDSGFKLSDLSKECFGKNTSGKIIYLNDTLDITDEKSSFWIYVKVLKLGDQETKSITTENKVKVDVYNTWYKLANWGGDGDPINSSTTTSQFRHGKLSPGAYRQIEVTFKPTEKKKYDGNITLTTDKGTFTAAVKGEGYQTATTDPGGGTGSETNTATIPTASILASEFYNYQDLDNNKLVYGYDFKITDDTENKPPKKPIILCILEKSPYWANPSKEISWDDFLAGETPGSSGGGGTTDGGSEDPDPKPTDVTNLTKHYGLAPTDGETYTFGNPLDDTDPLVKKYFNELVYTRCFIPPGTVVLDESIESAYDFVGVVRYKKPPTTIYYGKDSITPSTEEDNQPYPLSDITSKDRIIRLHGAMSYPIARDSFSNGLEINEAGWLYLKFTDGGGTGVEKNQQFSVRVNVEKYNTWYKEYIGSEERWKKYITDVAVFKNPEKL